MQPYSYVRTLICMHDRTHIRRLAHLCAALGPIALFGCAFDHLIDECVMFGSVLGNSLVGGGEVEGGVDVQVPAFVNEVARAEEHTSELKRRGHLVCRLL